MRHEDLRVVYASASSFKEGAIAVSSPVPCALSKLTSALALELPRRAQEQHVADTL